MKKIIKFGKIDYNKTGRKDNAVDIKINLNYKNNGPVFTASGYVWNLPHTDILMGGQC